MFRGKQGQSGAAILVALLAALIILYVLFLPPAERAALLGEGPNGPDGKPTTNLLFSTPVGVVYPEINPQTDHDLPSVHIRTVDSAAVLAQRDTLTASSNVFEKQTATIMFESDPKLTDNVVVSANLVAKNGGNVIMFLNGEEVFNQPGTSRNLPPIRLQNLQDENTLVFAASPVGFAFWETNRFTLSDVKVVADVTDVSSSRSTVRFTLANEELAYMERAQLSFVPICNEESALAIHLGGAELFTGTPDCGVMNTLDLAPQKLEAGENTLTFITDGDLIVDQGMVRTTGKRFENRIFRFNFNPAQAEGRPVLLRMMFADSSPKNGIITINGNTMPFRAQDTYAASISNYIKQGENVIQFEAVDDDFEVVRFDVLRG